MKKIICLLFMFMILTCIEAAAQEEVSVSEITYEDGVFTVHAVTPLEQPTYLSIVVLYPDASGAVRSYSPEIMEQPEAVKAMDQFQAVRKAGSYRIVMQPEDTDGEYHVRVNGPDGAAATASFTYKNDMEVVLVAKFVQEINEANTPNEIEELIAANAQRCNISLTGAYQDLDSSDKAKVCFALIGKNFTALPEIETAWAEALAAVKPKQQNNVGGTGGSRRESTNIVMPGTPGNPVTPVQEGFTDVPDNHWAKAYIDELTEKGILSGLGGGTFCPDAPVTRAQAVKIFGAAFSVAETGTANFADVDANAWYRTYLGGMQSAGIILGDENGNFRPNETITRQEIAALTGRILAYKNITLPMVVDEKRFADEQEIAPYAADFVSALQQADVLSGMTEDAFAPLQQATRAQLCKIVSCALALR